MTMADAIAGQFDGRYAAADYQDGHLAFQQLNVIVDLTSATWDHNLEPTGTTFVPKLGDTFVLWNYASVSGLENVRMTFVDDLPAGLAWSYRWTGGEGVPGNLTLTVVVPEPALLSAIGIGSAGLLRRRRRRELAA
jgi:hypothetical protein